MQEFEGSAEPLNLSHAFPALTGDIIMDYFFGFNYNQLKHPNFESFHDAFIKIGGVGHVATQFPMILLVGYIYGSEFGQTTQKADCCSRS